MAIPFKTLLQVETPPSIILPHHVTLGYQRKGYKSDVIDYSCYQDVCNKLLLSTCGHVALLQGGIVWCLAINVLSPEAVLSGPSSDTREPKEIFQTTDGHFFINDCLSQEELDLISGVYNVYTGHGPQMSQSSWWP
ncbi:hypothetical protein SERLA73DRAFT_44533 [Serpula lacrymans var. lacrymans S7.3]|uniref:Uncharacterized protein n=1 Tax=Serpula lacrymans var. lacrymans (strain S7.3) TaxID=936435 RepID=F8PH95_SERL3|nr:hypothetical protein SERLA73DRAFT_44533 [Serpula lacrymans var. lacrymans S7.3]